MSVCQFCGEEHRSIPAHLDNNDECREAAWAAIFGDESGAGK